MNLGHVAKARAAVFAVGVLEKHELLAAAAVEGFHRSGRKVEVALDVIAVLAQGSCRKKSAVFKAFSYRTEQRSAVCPFVSR
jgi:hypothetical protein